jgi:hypothetical protein
MILSGVSKDHSSLALAGAVVTSDAAPGLVYANAREASHLRRCPILRHMSLNLETIK